MSVKKNISEIKRSILTKGSFGRNLLVTTFGASSAYIVGFVFTPVLSRIYLPESYGEFAIFNALMINISLISTFGYEQAVIIPKQKLDFYSLVRISISSVTILCVILFFLSFLISDSILEYLDILKLKEWLWILPILILFNVTSQIFNTIGIRSKNFKSTSFGRVVAVVCSKAYALSHGLLISGNSIGFIIAELVGKIMHTFYLISDRNIFNSVLSSFKKLSVSNTISTAREFKNYPMYTLPSVWLFTLSMQLPIYVLAKLYEADDVGYFSMASTLLTIPLTIIGRSIGTVFLQKASELYNQKDFKRINYIIWEIIKKTLLVGVVPILIVLLFGQPIFKLILGDQWSAAGLYAKYMAVYFLFELVAVPVSMLYRVLRLERKLFFQSIISISIVAIALIIGSFYKQAEWLIIFLTIGKLIENSIKMGRILIILKKDFVSV